MFHNHTLRQGAQVTSRFGFLSACKIIDNEGHNILLSDFPARPTTNTAEENVCTPTNVLLIGMNATDEHGLVSHLCHVGH